MVEVLLGVTGCIGAYKVPELVRLLRAGGAGVTVVMTRNAGWFVTEGTLQTLSQRPVYGDMFRPRTADGIEHIDLARRADLLLVAPATAHTLASFAGGLADDLLSTIYLASACPVMVAPAMNSFMYQHSAVQANLEILRRRGVEVVGPGTGELACGESGPGRLLEPADIAAKALALAGGKTGQILAGLNVVISSGPTREPLDGVRFLSNPATGRMGHALAEAAIHRGATVTLVSGPTHLPDPAGARVVHVTRVEEMRHAILEGSEGSDLVVMAAAVGDYRLARPAAGKLKKSARGLDLHLEPAPDILAELGRRRGSAPRPVLVGFAAETDDLVLNARRKLEAKNLDHIVANPVNRAGAGFGAETNQVTLISRNGDTDSWPVMSKSQVAARLLDHLAGVHFSAAAGTEG